MKRCPTARTEQVTHESYLINWHEFTVLLAGMGCNALRGFVPETMPQRADMLRALHSLIQKSLITPTGDAFEVQQPLADWLRCCVKAHTLLSVSSTDSALLCGYFSSNTLVCVQPAAENMVRIHSCEMTELCGLLRDCGYLPKQPQYDIAAFEYDAPVTLTIHITDLMNDQETHEIQIQQHPLAYAIVYNTGAAQQWYGYSDETLKSLILRSIEQT